MFHNQRNSAFYRLGCCLALGIYSSLLFACVHAPDSDPEKSKILNLLTKVINAKQMQNLDLISAQLKVELLEDKSGFMSANNKRFHPVEPNHSQLKQVNVIYENLQRYPDILAFWFSHTVCLSKTDIERWLTVKAEPSITYPMHGSREPYHSGFNFYLKNAHGDDIALWAPLPKEGGCTSRLNLASNASRKVIR
jgi:hypothetical protein